MRSRAAVLCAVVAAVGGICWPAGAFKPPPRPRSPLAAIAALEKPVTYTEIKIPLGELIQKVAAETGVKLTATADVADEPVTVVVKELPARELLDQLAEMLDYLWSRRGQEGDWRYELWQDLAAKQREAALREERVTLAERRLQEEVRRHVEIARLSEAQLRALEEERKALERQFEQMPLPQIAALLFSGQLTTFFQRMQRLETARQLASPITRSLARLLGQLTPAQWAALRSGEPVVFSTGPAEGQSALPETLGRTFRATPITIRDEFAPDWPPEEVAQARQQNEELRDRWKNAAGYRVTISEDRSGMSTQGSLSLDVRVQPARSLDEAHSDFFAGEDTSLHFSSHSGADAMEQMLAGLAPERRAENESDPVLSEKKVLSLQEPDRRFPETDRQRQLRRFLLDLTRDYEVHALADAYGGGSYSFGSQEVYSFGLLPLWQRLDIACGPTHRWDYRGRVIRFRSRTWFIERPREVPQRLLRQWKDQLDRRGALTLDDWARIGSLRDEQLQELAGLDSSSGLSSEFTRVYQQRHMLRLYAALPPAQRQMLWEGRRLSLAALTPQQRQHFLAALREDGGAQAAELKAVWLATAGLSLERQPLLRVRMQHGDTIVYGTENLVPSQPAPSPEPTPAGRGPRITRYPALAVQLITHYGPAAHGSVFIVVAAP